MLEFRVIWDASSNISFRGHTDWFPGEDWGETEDEIEEALNMGGPISEGFEIMVDAAGLSWGVEFRDS